MELFVVICIVLIVLFIIFRKKSKSHNSYPTIEQTMQNQTIERDKKEILQVENLFQKLSKDLFTNGHPKEIIIYTNRLDLIFDSNEKQSLFYKNYNSDDLKGYMTYSVSDGSTSEKRVNQAMLLAQKINEKSNKIYSSNSEIKRLVTSAAEGETMYIFDQLYVSMKKQ